MEAVLEMLAGELPERGAADIDGWLSRLAGLRAAWPRPIERAIAAGLRADRLGYAFAGGYQAALEALAGELEGPAALCATESGGNHPRAIETALEPADDGGGWLTGEKTVVTLGDRAEVLLVAARASIGADGRPEIRLVSIARDSDGVAIEPAPPLPFVPEISHVRVRFDRAKVAPQPGISEDGYPRIKAFRTVEDVHVHAATAGYLIGAARLGGWDPGIVESLLASAAALWALAQAPPLSPVTHLALAGVIEQAAAPLEQIGALFEGEEGQRWQRDRVLLAVAGKARDRRRQRARQALG